MKRTVCLALGLSLLSARVEAQAPGTAGFRTQQQQRDEFIQKLRRDIAKVAHSVEVTKELIGRSRGAPFLPDIYLRLAELYVEQARYEFYLVHEERGEGSKGSIAAPTAKLLKEKAIETYERILSDFPDFKDNDKVYFFLAHEYRELGSYEQMIAQYEKLVAKYPKSPLVLDSYLVLGDYRFDKQDLQGAKRYYQKILDAPESPSHDMAHFKMGWVYINESDDKEAVNQFELAVNSGNDPDKAQSRKEAQRLVNVKKEALVDLAFVYPNVKKPEHALKYFRDLSTGRNMYVTALSKLARRYFVKQDYASAAMMYREITELSNDTENNLDFTTQIYNAATASKNYKVVHKDVEVMLKALDDYRFDWRVAESQRKAAESDFEQFTRDLSTKAQASAGKSKQLGPRVALAYTRYLESFPDNDHRRDITENLADTLYESELFLRAGDRYEEAARLAEGDDKAKEEALYNACAAFHEALKNASKMPRFDRVWAQQGLIKNGQVYVESFPSSGKVPEIKLNIGRSYYEAGEFDTAIGIFNEFIATYPTHASAVTVADLILDSYAQTQDFENLAVRAKELAAIPNLGDGAFKSRMLQTAKQAEERQIGETILTASVNKEAAGSNAGEVLRKFWEANKGSPVAEKTLYTAFVQYKEARDFDKTFETGNQFIGAYPQSQYLGDVFGTLASFTTQTGEYEQATVYYEEYYKRFPTDVSAQKYLAASGDIKQLIGDHRGAIAAYRELLNVAKDKQLRQDYSAKMLDSYEALADWEGMQAAANDVLRIDPESVKAHLMLGLVAQKAGDLDGAVLELQQAIRAAGRGSDEQIQDDAARASFMLGDVLYRRFEKIDAGGDLQAAVGAKAELLGEIESALVDAVGYGRGVWAVAALHRAALAYSGFVSFLENAPAPEGLSAAEVQQYRQLVAEQTAGIKAKSEEFYDTCTKKARELNVYTGAALGCVDKGPEENVAQVSASGAAPPQQRKDTLKVALTKNPKDLEAIADLTDYFLLNREPAKAKLMASKGLEIEERDGRFHNKLGMADLLLGKPEVAFASFQRAADLKHPYAAANAAAIMIAFKDLEGAKKIAQNVDAADIPAGAADVHPGAASALGAIQR